MKKNIGERTFNAALYIFMIAVVFVVVYPLWYVLIASLSEATAVSQGKVLFWVKNFNLGAYKRTLTTANIGTAYLNTLYYTVFGTALSMALTIGGSYALSKPRLHGRKIFMIFMTVTMWFSAGMIPTYLTYRSYNLLDTRLGILMCGTISAFYVIILRSFFETVPDSLEESAKLDGASDLRILMSIYLPLSGATLMTLTLYYMVMRWNGYFWAMILLKDDNKIPLQVVLKKLIVTMSGLFDNGSDSLDTSVTSAESIVYSTIVIAAAPMLIVYPFIQRFFVKGVMVGAVKG